MKKEIIQFCETNNIKLIGVHCQYKSVQNVLRVIIKEKFSTLEIQVEFENINKSNKSAVVQKTVDIMKSEITKLTKSLKSI